MNEHQTLRDDGRATFSVIDLFCGAGGLSTGLELAGWRTVAALDIDSDSIATMKAARQAAIPVEDDAARTYLAGAKLLCGDIAETSRRDLIPPGVGRHWRPDLLAGGPPCQPFSSAGRMRGFADPRGMLFEHFVRLAFELKPRFVLFENVAGLVTAKGRDGKPGSALKLVQRSFENIGYACRFALLNSADYGAPQRRVRLFMIASRSELIPDFPAPTHSRDGASSFGLRPWVSLYDFVAARPAPAEADIVRPRGRRAEELGRLRDGTGLRARGIVEANRPGGHWGYRQDCFVADQSVPSRTIRAASTPDWIRASTGSLRRLTWRECAALQGFPEAWPFQGTIASKFRQIGNAVQGDVASALGIALYGAAADARTARSLVSVPWPESFHRRVRYTAAEASVNGASREAARGVG